MTIQNNHRDETKLRMIYGVAFDYLLAHPEFDGRRRPGQAGLRRARAGTDENQPWPGAADVRRMTREQWIDARLEAVARGDEKPALRL